MIELDVKTPVEQRVENLLSRMTREEKVAQMIQVSSNMVSEDEAEEWAARGAGSFLHTLGGRAEKLQRIASETRLGIPLLFGIDAVRGHALYNGATIFPCPLAMACSWDEELMLAVGRATAEEIAADGLHWTFAPLLCLARDLRWGRVNETFGEDPVLTGAMAAAMIKGLQGQSLSDPDSVMACAKHYIAYGESTGGRDSVDAPITMRKIREVFLPPFQRAVEAGCATVMSGYSSIDGVPMTSHAELLNGVLKRELGFDGFVVTDWQNVLSLVEKQHVAENLEQAAKQALLAGNDMVMVTNACYDAALALLERGEVAQEAVDEAVRRILRMKFRLGLFDEKRFAKKNAACIHSREHQALNRRMQLESIVLLKNNGALPLAQKKIAVVGPNADDVNATLGDWTFLTHPDPKPETKPLAPVSTVVDGLRRLGTECGAEVRYARGCGWLDESEKRERNRDNLQESEAFSYELNRAYGREIDEAVRVAGECDVIVACVGDFIGQNGEYRDRADLSLSGHQMELLKALRGLGKPLIVVLISGKPLCTPWINEHADAVVQAFNGGQELGGALAEILLGRENPSGKLPISYARHTGQLPVYYNQLPGWHGGKYVDLPAEPLYAFGYGLSYAEYAYSDLDVRVDGGARRVEVSATVANCSNRDGAEVSQLYFRDRVSAVMTPVKRLLGFERVRLAAGESRRVFFSVPFESLGFYDSNQRLTLEDGGFTFWLGGSSRDEDLLSRDIDIVF